MSSIPPPPRIRRDWTIPIVAGVLAVVIVLVICALGSAGIFLASRKTPAPTTPPPIASPSVPVPPPTAMHPADCLIGEWEQTSYVTTAMIFGVNVQLKGKGVRIQFGAESSKWMSQNVVLSGTADGKRYEVIFNSTIETNYQADDTTIHYSNPKAQGTTVWKIDGKVRETEPTTATMNSDTYKCSGNELRLYADKTASEWRRILPPGVPV